MDKTWTKIQIETGEKSPSKLKLSAYKVTEICLESVNRFQSKSSITHQLLFVIVQWLMFLILKR